MPLSEEALDKIDAVRDCGEHQRERRSARSGAAYCTPCLRLVANAIIEECAREIRSVMEAAKAMAEQGAAPGGAWASYFAAEMVLNKIRALKSGGPDA